MSDAALIEVTTAAHLAELKALFLEYQRAIGVDLCFQNFEAELAGLPGEYAPPRGRLLLAQVDGAWAGCAALHPLEEGAGELKRLYVRPGFEGRGLGRRLVERLIADARAIGYRTLRLDTLPQMAAAQGLYRSLGFRPIESYRYNPLPGALYFELAL